MTNDTTDKDINLILIQALIDIREKHGLAIEQISVQWMSTLKDPAAVINSITVIGDTMSRR